MKTIIMKISTLFVIAVAFFALTGCDLIAQPGIAMLNGTPLGDFKGSIVDREVPTLDDDQKATIDLSSPTGVSDGWLDQDFSAYNRDWRIINIKIDGFPGDWCTAIRCDKAEECFSIMPEFVTVGAPGSVTPRVTLTAEAKNIAWQGTKRTNRHITGITYYYGQNKVASPDSNDTGSIDGGQPMMRFTEKYKLVDHGKTAEIVTLGYDISLFNKDGSIASTAYVTLAESKSPELKAKLVAHAQTFTADDSAVAQN